MSNTSVKERGVGNQSEAGAIEAEFSRDMRLFDSTFVSVGAIPEAVSHRAKNTVLMAKRYPGIVPRLSRLWWK